MKGEEFGKHKRNSPYMVVDNLTNPLFKGGWEVAEELTLLEGIELYGFGNWKAVSIHIGSRTAEECSKHYDDIYFSAGPDTDPMPNPSMLCIDSNGRTLEEDGDSDTNGAPAAKRRKRDRNDSTSVLETSSSASQRLSSSLDSNARDTMVRDAAALGDVANVTEYVSGYMPLRGDFDVEHDNDAELILADMEFSEDDHESERALKLKIIEIYNSKLDERERRKKFVLERGLLDYKKHQAIERRRPKDEREIYNRLKCFARFHSPEEHEEFVQGIIKEMRLRERIAKLQEYRKAGIRTLREAEQYEVDKRRREKEQESRKRRQNNSYLYASAPKKTSRARANRYAERDGSSKASSSSAASTKSSSAAESSSQKRAPLGPLDVSDAPDVEMLTESERDLCSSLRLLPKHYIVIKDTIVRESLRLGYLSSQDARAMLNIDIRKTGRLYDFFVSAGFVSQENPSNAK